MNKKRADIYTSSCYVRKYNLFCYTYYIYGLEKDIIKRSNYLVDTFNKDLNKKTFKFLPIIEVLEDIKDYDMKDININIHLERHETYNFIKTLLKKDYTDENPYVKKLYSLLENTSSDLRFKYNLELNYDREVIKENQQFMEQLKRDRDIILLYTDGSFKINQKVGTWSYTYYYKNGEKSYGPVGDYLETDFDNNYFELHAVIEGLKQIYKNIYTYNKNVCIILKTDSKFVIESLKEAKHKKMKFGKKDYLNDIKSEFQTVFNQFKCPIIVRHVQSHSDNIRNILVDKKCKSLYPSTII
nr:RNase H family protein [Haloplasma contractile]